MITPANWDLSLMLKLNFDGGPVMDAVMWYLSSIPFWMPLYLTVIFFVYKRFGWKNMLVFIVCGLLMTFCIESVSTFFKYNLPKFRPTHYPPLEGMLHMVRNYTGGLYGTVSAHAGNTLGFAILTSMIFRRKWYTAVILFWALLVSYSRIYLGAHYPADILFGFINGAIWGILAWLLYRYVTSRIGRLVSGKRRRKLNSGKIYRIIKTTMPLK